MYKAHHTWTIDMIDMNKVGGSYRHLHYFNTSIPEYDYSHHHDNGHRCHKNGNIGICLSHDWREIDFADAQPMPPR